MSRRLSVEGVRFTQGCHAETKRTRVALEGGEERSGRLGRPVAVTDTLDRHSARNT